MSAAAAAAAEERLPAVGAVCAATVCAEGQRGRWQLLLRSCRCCSRLPRRHCSVVSFIELGCFCAPHPDQSDVSRPGWRGPPDARTEPVQPEVPVSGYQSAIMHVAALLTSRDRLPIGHLHGADRAECCGGTARVPCTCTTCRRAGHVGRSSNAPGGPFAHRLRSIPEV